jgi:hypothetical protein
MSANQMPGRFRVCRVSHLNPAGLIAPALPRRRLECQGPGGMLFNAAASRVCRPTEAAGQSKEDGTLSQCRSLADDPAVGART